MGWSSGEARTDVSEARTAHKAAIALAPFGPIWLLLRSSSSTLLTVLSRSASHRMVVPSCPSLFPLTKILVSEALTKCEH